MTFEPTEDVDLIRAIVTHPRIYGYLTDDFSPPREEFKPPIAESIMWLLARDDDGTILGVWMFVKLSAIHWEIHTALLPHAWGPKARYAATAMLRWLWSHTTCMRLITHIPAYNRLAVKFAVAAGMELFGRDRRSFLKDGVLVDQLLYGVSAPEVLCP